MARTNQDHHDRDLREVPLYTLAEVAHHVHVPRATLRSWLEGRDYVAARELRHSSRVLVRPDSEDERLSFNNLIEAHVLRALRTRHGVSMNMVRKALAYAEAECRLERLLISDELEAASGEMFLREYGRLLSLTHSGQFAIEMVLKGFLQRVVRDAKGLPRRLYRRSGCLRRPQGDRDRSPALLRPSQYRKPGDQHDDPGGAPGRR